MLGGMLAGTEHTPGPTKQNASGQIVKQYRGMASHDAQVAYIGEVHEWKTSEGVSTEVVYREEAEIIINDIIGGLRSGLTYGGASTVRELQRKLNYMVISQASRVESLPHKTL